MGIVNVKIDGMETFASKIMKDSMERRTLFQGNFKEYHGCFYIINTERIFQKLLDEEKQLKKYLSRTKRKKSLH